MNRRVKNAVALVLLSGLIMTADASATAAQTWRRMTQLPGVNMAGLNQRQQQIVLEILREEDCPCGCNMKLAQCRVEDQTCPVSPRLVKRVTDAARQGQSAFIIRGLLISGLPSGQLNQALTFQSVRVAALAEQFEEPEFTTPQGGNTDFYYDFGPSIYGERKVPEYDTLAYYPIGLQHTVEVLRKYRSREFWEPHLQQVEAIVQNQIAWLTSNRSRRDVAQQLHQQSVRAYEILDEAVSNYAQTQGWTAKLVIKAPAAGPSVDVALEVIPAGATVYYASDYTFRATAKLGLRAIRDVNRNWNQFGLTGKGRTPTKKLPMSGRVRFYAVWPNGREEMKLVDLQIPPPENRNFVNIVRIRSL